jgi:hypothetical protein
MDHMTSPKLISAWFLGWAIIGLGSSAVFGREDPPASKSLQKPKSSAPAGAGSATDPSDDPPVEKPKDAKPSGPEQVLLDKGLIRDNRKFLLDETSALETLQEVHALWIKYQDALMKFSAIVEFDDNLATLNAQWQSMQQQANALQQEINRTSATAGRYRGAVNYSLAPVRQQHAQLVAQANQLKAEHAALQKKSPKPAERDAATKDLENAKQAYIDAVRELDQRVTPLMNKYQELAHDKSVGDALVQLRHETTLNFKLGPSDELRSAAKLIKDLNVNTAAPSKTKTGAKKKATPKSSS